METKLIKNRIVDAIVTKSPREKLDFLLNLNEEDERRVSINKINEKLNTILALLDIEDELV